MSAEYRRVVVTGLGVVTPIGIGAAPFWQALSEGKSGIRTISAFDASALPTRFTGDVRGFEPKTYLLTRDAKKSLRVMTRTIQLAVAAAQLAVDDAKMVKLKAEPAQYEHVDPARFGVEFGAGLIASELPELGPASQLASTPGSPRVDLHIWGKEGREAIQPLWMLKYLPNMLACHVSILHNAQGPCNSVTESDAASLLALGEAYRILRRNGADLFIVGGGDSKVNPLSMVRQCLFSHLSRRNDAPEKACRPFEKHRDGSVIGEGGGALVVEELQHARRRGAVPLAEVLGFGSAFDRGMTGAGMVRAMRAALAQAHLAPEDIDHVNANGLGSVAIDAAEARAIGEVFGQRREPVPVLAVKSYVGNLGAGSGLTELSASLLALRHGTLPATLNYDEPDPACPVAVTRGNRPVTRPNFLKLSFTEMGQCAAVVCKKWQE